MPNPFFILVACSLAVYRGAKMITSESGPMLVFKKLRAKCKGHPALCEFVNCPYCVSAYIAMLVVLFLWVSGPLSIIHPVLWWGAIWGGASVLIKALE